MNYRHLTLEQRDQIAALHRAGFSQQHSAAAIGCHPSTISRELRRNRRGKIYVGSIAPVDEQRASHGIDCRGCGRWWTSMPAREGRSSVDSVNTLQLPLLGFRVQ